LLKTPDILLANDIALGGGYYSDTVSGLPAPKRPDGHPLTICYIATR
jgi:hypothetical protein